MSAIHCLLASSLALAALPRIEGPSDWAVEVLVVDPSGAPLTGLGVCLRYSTGNGAEYADILSTRSAVDRGCARIEHVGALQAKHGRGHDYYVGLTGWIGEPVVAWLPSNGPTRTAVKLVLPPHGRLELQVVDESHAPATAIDPLWVGVDGVLPQLVAWPTVQEGDLLRGGQGYVVVPLAKGSASLAHVAVGARLRACIQRNEQSSPSLIDIAGPTRAGETARADLVLGSGCVTLRGRVLGPKGEPFVGHNLQFHVAGEQALSTGRLLKHRLPLDAEGRFVFDLDAAGLRGPGREIGLHWMQDYEGVSATDGDLGLWRFDPLDKLWSVGTHDLGDLELEANPLFAAGQVLDAKSREPLAHVSVVARGVMWISASPVTSDDQGRFELRMLSELSQLDLEFTLAAHGGGVRRALSKVHRGTRDLVVELDSP